MNKPLALVIEDTRDIADLYGHMLGMIGFETEIITHAATAQHMLQSLKPTLILLDLQLGSEITGETLLNQIRRSEDLVDTLVIIITGHPRLSESLGDKADMVLIKPIDIRNLGIMIMRLLSERKKANEFLTSQLFGGITVESEFRERLAINLQRSAQSPQHLFAVLMLAAEQTNSSATGLPAEVSVQVAERIQRRLRIADTCAKLTDSEFAVMLYGIHEPANAEMVIQRLAGAIEEPFDLMEREIQLKATTAIVLGDRAYSDADQMMRDAQQKLEQSRQEV
jgi:DNA-binding response OmpR family regulator